MLLLDKWFIEKIQLQSEIQPSQGPKKLEVKNSITPYFFISKHDGEKYKITLEIKAYIKETGFIFNMTVSGFFTIKDESEKAILENAPSMLLTAAQSIGDIILNKTPYPNLEIPHF